MTPEFSRPVRVDTIGEARAVDLEADEGERQGLARRFGLVAIDRLAAALTVARVASGVLVEGRIEAAVIQRCVATGAPLPAMVAEPVRLLFAEDAASAPEELELGAGDLDTLPIAEGTIDLGEAAAETMALALDPYPRAAGSDEALSRAGILREGEEAVGPFAALAALRDKLGGQDG